MVVGSRTRVGHLLWTEGDQTWEVRHIDRRPLDDRLPLNDRQLFMEFFLPTWRLRGDDSMPIAGFLEPEGSLRTNKPTFASDTPGIFLTDPGEDMWAH